MVDYAVSILKYAGNRITNIEFEYSIRGLIVKLTKNDLHTRFMTYAEESLETLNERYTEPALQYLETYSERQDDDLRRHGSRH